MVEQAMPDLPGLQPDVFLPVLVDHVIDPALLRPPRLAARHLRPGQVLQLQGDVLKDVPHPRPFPHPLDEPPGVTEGTPVVVERRNRGDETVDESVDLVGRTVFQLADVGGQENDGHPCPHVGSAEDLCLTDLQHHDRPFSLRLPC
jgi:hypothetical protein